MLGTLEVLGALGVPAGGCGALGALERSVLYYLDRALSPGSLGQSM